MNTFSAFGISFSRSIGGVPPKALAEGHPMGRLAVVQRGWQQCGAGVILTQGSLLRRRGVGIGVWL